MPRPGAMGSPGSKTRVQVATFYKAQGATGTMAELALATSLYARARMYMLVAVTAIYIASIFLGKALVPPEDFIREVRERYEREVMYMNELLNRSFAAAFAHRLYLLITNFGPSLIPIFGTWYSSMVMVNYGTVSNALPAQWGSLIASLALLAVIVAMPSSDSLLMVPLLYNYLVNKAPRPLVMLAIRWYLASVATALALMTLYALILW